MDRHRLIVCVCQKRLRASQGCSCCSSGSCTDGRRCSHAATPLFFAATGCACSAAHVRQLVTNARMQTTGEREPRPPFPETATGALVQLTAPCSRCGTPPGSAPSPSTTSQACLPGRWRRLLRAKLVQTQTKQVPCGPVKKAGSASERGRVLPKIPAATQSAAFVRAAAHSRAKIPVRDDINARVRCEPFPVQRGWLRSSHSEHPCPRGGNRWRSLRHHRARPPPFTF